MLAFRLRDEDAGFTVYDVSERMRTYGWIIPAYRMPEGMEEVMVQKLEHAIAFDRETTLAGPVTASLSFSCNDIDSYVVLALSRVDEGGQLCVRQRAARADEGGVVAVRRARALEQLDRGVQPRGVPEALHEQVGPLVHRRQVVAGERVGRHQARSPAAASAWRAMITCCTSLAPS